MIRPKMLYMKIPMTIRSKPAATGTSLLKNFRHPGRDHLLFTTLFLADPVKRAFLFGGKEGFKPFIEPGKGQ